MLHVVPNLVIKGQVANAMKKIIRNLGHRELFMVPIRGANTQKLSLNFHTSPITVLRDYDILQTQTVYFRK